MFKVSRYWAMAILAIGVVCIVIGGVFIFQSVDKGNWMREAMRQEKVTLGLSEEQIAAGEVIDTAEEAMAAGDVIRQHRQNIASSYSELLAGGQYDPTNPLHLEYAQAMNMENYLYLAVLGFGVSTAILGTGVFMILVGIAISIVGIVFFRCNRTAAC
jgi:hypothetical protein